jgi:hypothetical protein
LVDWNATLLKLAVRLSALSVTPVPRKLLSKVEKATDASRAARNISRRPS